MSKPLLSRSERECPHGAIYVPRRDLSADSFEARFGVTTQGDHRCGCCGRYWLDGCPICNLTSGQAPIPAGSGNENHAHGEAGRASQSDPSENHIGLDSSRLNPAGRSDHLTGRVV